MLQKVDIFYSLLFPLLSLCLEFEIWKLVFFFPAFLLLSLPFFHPPVTLGYLLRIRFHARLRASAVQIRSEAVGQRQQEGEGIGRRAKVQV